MTKEQQTFYNYTITQPDGQTKDEKYKSEKQFNEAVADAKKTPNVVLSDVDAQTFEVTTADTYDEILTVTPDQAVALEYYNYGLTLRQHGVKRDMMLDPNFQPTEGAYPLINDVQVPKERKQGDPMTKSRNSLKALWAKMNPGAPLPTDDEINAVLAQFAGAAQPSAATQIESVSAE